MRSCYNRERAARVPGVPHAIGRRARRQRRARAARATRAGGGRRSLHHHGRRDRGGRDHSRSRAARTARGVRHRSRNRSPPADLRGHPARRRGARALSLHHFRPARRLRKRRIDARRRHSGLPLAQRGRPAAVRRLAGRREVGARGAGLRHIWLLAGWQIWLLLAACAAAAPAPTVTRAPTAAPARTPTPTPTPTATPVPVQYAVVGKARGDYWSAIERGTQAAEQSLALPAGSVAFA